MTQRNKTSSESNGSAARVPPPNRPPRRRGAVSKLEAVRQALYALGDDCKPKVIQEYVLETFGITMTTDHISTYKGDILKGRFKPSTPRLQNVTGPGWNKALSAVTAAHRLVLMAGGAEAAKTLIDTADRLARELGGLSGGGEDADGETEEARP